MLHHATKNQQHPKGPAPNGWIGARENKMVELVWYTIKKLWRQQRRRNRLSWCQKQDGQVKQGSFSWCHEWNQFGNIKNHGIKRGLSISQCIQALLTRFSLSWVRSNKRANLKMKGQRSRTVPWSEAHYCMNLQISLQKKKKNVTFLSCDMVYGVYIWYNTIW